MSKKTITRKDINDTWRYHNVLWLGNADVYDIMIPSPNGMILIQDYLNMTEMLLVNYINNNKDKMDFKKTRENFSEAYPKHFNIVLKDDRIDDIFMFTIQEKYWDILDIPEYNEHVDEFDNYMNIGEMVLFLSNIDNYLKYQEQVRSPETPEEDEFGYLILND